MIFAATGHRPEKLTHEKWGLVDDYLPVMDDLFNRLQPDKLIIGMAAGFDLMAGLTAFANRIPYICAVPWKGHAPRVDDRATYRLLIEHSVSVEYINPSEMYPGPWVYQRRNEWMVDHAEYIVSCWDGSRGGTYNCIKYADEEGKTVFNIDPATLESRMLTSKEIMSA